MDTTQQTTRAISLDRVNVQGSHVEYDIRSSGEVSRFFSGRPLEVDYGVDITDVPKSLLVVPALAQVCPVAWACGVDVHVETVDQRFLDSLRHVEESFRDLFPEMIDGGEIHCNHEEVVELPSNRTTRTGLLFTGGVDSMRTYLRHRTESPSLITIQGWMINEEDRERWEQTKRRVETFANTEGVDINFVRSNIVSFLQNVRLYAEFREHVVGAWYEGVGHGIGLLGLCAPLAFVKGIDPLYIAASYTDEFSMPSGSHPTVENNVEWSGTSCALDGHNESRQDKIEAIASYLETGDNELQLHTCSNDPWENCSNCEKCYRTIIGLLLAGVDPNSVGYTVSNDTFDKVQEGLVSGDWLTTEAVLFYWEDIQERIPDAEPVEYRGSDQFFQWLQTADLRELYAQSAPPLSHRLFLSVAPHIPENVYSIIRTGYDKWKGN